VVLASVLKVQVLETSVLLGDTIQATPPALHIRNPPSIDTPSAILSKLLGCQVAGPTVSPILILQNSDELLMHITF
jgi:hypothetical protein